MNGPEHFVEAERLLEAAKEAVRSVDASNKVAYAIVMDRADIAIRAAAVHADLAAAAALIERLADLGERIDELVGVNG